MNQTLLFENEVDALLHELMCPMAGCSWLTGTGKHWTNDNPSGWRELLCWNWGGVKYL